MTSEEFWDKIKALKLSDFIDGDKSDPCVFAKACERMNQAMGKIFEDFEKERNL